MATSPWGTPETTDVCVVETGGVTAALLDRDIVCILALESGPRVGNVRTLMLDDRPRALVSLRETLCIDGGGPEEVVVMLQLGDHVFGLAVERVRAIEQAVVMPTLDPPYPLAMFAHLAHSDVAGALTVLNPARLAMCVGGADQYCREAA